MDLDDAVKHPVSALFTLLGSVSYLLDPAFLEGLMLALWTSVGSLFTFLSIGTFTVPRIFPEISFLVPYLKAAFAGVLVLYLLKIASQTFQNFKENL